MNNHEIKLVAAQFCFEGSLEEIRELTSGLINNSYHLKYRLEDGGMREYVLQQINTFVFKQPEQVMSNVQRVTEHLHRVLEERGEDASRRALHLISTVDGGNMYRDEQDRCWRAYDFILSAVAYDRAESPELFSEAGAAFGEFQAMLMSFPAEELYDTIPDFHNTKKRYETFLETVKADRAGKVKDIAAEIAFFTGRREMMSAVVDMLESGEMPLRVTHNDTKMNNVMLDAETGKGMCVIDLDTVMPGSVLYDYGDAIRFGANNAAEDEPDLSKISLNMELFRAFTRGFVSQINGSLTENELRMLPLGIKVITCELAMRFLTDYIDGDLYFKVRYPEHNLVRARAQMKLLEDVEAKYEEMCAFIGEMIG